MQELQPSEMRYEGVHCTLVIQQTAPSVILLKISGSDVGEFGETPMAALEDWLTRIGPFDLFIDARNVRGASIDVSNDWAKWLGRNRSKLRGVTMLTGSRFVQFTAEFVRQFADLEGIMRICTEPSVFENALREAQHWR